jgi:hypothetical protein
MPMSIVARHHRSSARFGLVGLCVLTLIASQGCGSRSRGPRRYDISGAVTFRGEPVPSGVIYFEPDASQGNRGPVSVVPIVVGRYDTVAHKCPGPLEGPAVVRIVGYPDAKPGQEVVPPLFPEYRTTAVVAPSRAGIVIDFDVPVSRPPSSKR